MSKLTLSFKGKVLKIFPVLKGTMTLGSDPRCAIFIDSLAIQSEHAEIDASDNNTVIRDLGTEEGTFIGTTKVEGLHTLKDGEVIRIGKHTLAYMYSEDINNTGEIDAIVESVIKKGSFGKENFIFVGSSPLSFIRLSSNTLLTTSLKFCSLLFKLLSIFLFERCAVLFQSLGLILMPVG